MNKKIAILMSTYNGEKYINEQLESISKQSLINDIRLYVRDDGSTDTTISIIKNWMAKMDIVLFEAENVGPARSFWELLINDDIISEYYLFCDQDDIWDDTKVEESIAGLCGDFVLSFCNSRYVDQNKKVVKEKRLVRAPKITLESLFVAGIAQGCTMTFTDKLRRFVIEKKLKYIPMHDIIIMMYAYILGNIKWIEKPLMSYRLHDANVVAKAKKRKIQIIKTVLSNLKKSKQISMSSVATEMMNNQEMLKEEELIFLKNMSRYKKSLISKLYIINNRKCTSVWPKAERSFKIRVLLNLL